jgi:hypothetical protein
LTAKRQALASHDGPGYRHSSSQMTKTNWIIVYMRTFSTVRVQVYPSCMYPSIVSKQTQQNARFDVQ